MSIAVTGSSHYSIYATPLSEDFVLEVDGSFIENSREANGPWKDSAADVLGDVVRSVRIIGSRNRTQEDQIEHKYLQYGRMMAVSFCMNLHDIDLHLAAAAPLRAQWQLVH